MSRLRAGTGEPEDQLRGPLETLIKTAGAAIGLRLTVIGETSIGDIQAKPDYAVLVDGALTGYVEVKAPGKGAQPANWPAKSHDRRQWEKLRVLPNVLYTDGEKWGLYRSGEMVGDIVRLKGDIRSSGGKLLPPDDGLARTLLHFFRWAPVPPPNVEQLVRMVAPITRLLRDEVAEALAREEAAGTGPFMALARDWRGLLFPDADDAKFADGYAQSVTFALILARTEGIAFDGKAISDIARELGKSHSLLGRALAFLTDEMSGAFAVSLDTLLRVLSVVDFGAFPDDVADPYLALYEHFLASYDPKLRKETGSYYTPPAVVAAMTRLTDQVLRTRLDRPAGLADPDVTIVDPAMGTGA